MNFKIIKMNKILILLWWRWINHRKLTPQHTYKINYFILSSYFAVKLQQLHYHKHVTKHVTTAWVHSSHERCSFPDRVNVPPPLCWLLFMSEVWNMYGCMSCYIKNNKSFVKSACQATVVLDNPKESRGSSSFRSCPMKLVPQ